MLEEDYAFLNSWVFSILGLAPLPSDKSLGKFTVAVEQN
jgi:hypothetical protein